jgi:hypothetical protein
MSQRFPQNDTSTEGAENPAIQLYGRRFYKDQTPVEYLAEFLLVFASPKGSEPDPTTKEQEQVHAFSFSLGDGSTPAQYWPEDRVALKLFAFFPASKLDTRHDVHQQAYADALATLRDRIDASQEDREETIRLLQSLLAGFVGISANRTWATNSFLPASASLLSRELDWLHSKASRNTNVRTWEDGRQYFATDRHNFMARGGELLFLQLANLFDGTASQFADIVRRDEYAHLAGREILEVRQDIENGLKRLLVTTTLPIREVVTLIEGSLPDIRLFDQPKRAALGWVPTKTELVAGLFAFELCNIVTSSISDLEKVESLQNLCCLHVLRTLSFLAASVDEASPDMDKFIGSYAWVVASEDAPSGSALRKIAERSFASVEQLLFRVLRRDEEAKGSMKEADKHGFDIFRALAKKIGLVVPRTGPGLRFVLPPNLLHLLVISVVEPGGRIPLDTFYERVFAHYGIALGPRQLAAALAQQGQDGADYQEYAVAADTRWIEETLRQGDFLVELSDAVSIVRNPAARAALTEQHG